ncbi:hypothetical protein AVEN_24823-1 [Araneus ventricosus]|uniref:Uncharacterized protein n=1 Tax=Araneus ventricosus TaxID=182803 RepID=A0A4Y2BWE1_ARAVE|nr:hypothetical protein AVEN_24823-1 [Araneus ventricosus]
MACFSETSRSKLHRGGLVLRSGLRGWRAPGSRPDSTEDPQWMCDWSTLNMTAWVKRPPSSVVRKFGERVSAQVLSSSLEHSLKLRGTFQNSLRLPWKGTLI